MNFGAFLAPHHPIGEHPMLQFRRDLELLEHLDGRGYHEFWAASWHIAETREKARVECPRRPSAALQRIHHRNPPAARCEAVQDARPAMDLTAFSDGAAATTIVTPDDLVQWIKDVLAISDGFGTVVGFVHDWANPENTMRTGTWWRAMSFRRSTDISRVCGNRGRSWPTTASTSTERVKRS
ncbi:MAG: hypothetical protein ABSC06_20620 [Rhodopila sp.]